MSNLNLIIEVENDFASIEKRYSDKADIRLKDFVPNPTDELPDRRKDLEIQRLSVAQIKQLYEVLSIYIAAVDKDSVQ